LRITDIETVGPCLPALRPIDAGCRSLRLIRIHTNEGITGISDDYADPRISKAIIETPNIALDPAIVERCSVT
jgi:L-rhamnonate dehydratase